MNIQQAADNLTWDVLSSLEYYEMDEDTIVIATYDFVSSTKNKLEQNKNLQIYKKSITDVVNSLADRFPKRHYEISKETREAIIKQCYEIAHDIICEISPLSAYLEDEENLESKPLPKAVAGLSIELTATEEMEKNGLRVLTALAILNEKGNYELKKPDKTLLN